MTDYLKYKNHLATISCSDTNEVFYGKILGINDLVTFEGTSVSILKKAFHEAVNDHVDMYNELGKSPQ